MRRHASSHPEVVGWKADALYVIAARLGQLVKIHGGEPFGDIDPLGTEYLDDVLRVASSERARPSDDLEEMD